MNLTEFKENQKLETLMMNHTYKSQKFMNTYLTSLLCKIVILKIAMATKTLIKICQLKLTLKRNSITRKAKLSWKNLNSKEDSHLLLMIHHYLKIRLYYCVKMLQCLFWVLINLV